MITVFRCAKFNQNLFDIILTFCWLIRVLIKICYTPLVWVSHTKWPWLPLFLYSLRGKNKCWGTWISARISSVLCEVRAKSVDWRVNITMQAFGSRLMAVKLALVWFSFTVLRLSRDSIILQALHTNLSLTITVFTNQLGEVCQPSYEALPRSNYSRCQESKRGYCNSITHNYVIYSITQTITSTNNSSLDKLTKRQ